MYEDNKRFSNFWVIGINYKKADVSIRGDFAINQDQYINLLHLAHNFGVEELFVLSTCNRTEIYALADCPFLIKKLLCTQTKGTIDTLNAQSYTIRGDKAIEHLYEVAAGLDSQILGDYEIVSQIKEAIKIAKNHKGIGIFTERLFQSVLQSSRDIRSKTHLSSGSVSVAYAAFQYIIQNATEILKEQILIIGSGKMGIASCKNLLQIVPKENIAICNRTHSKAEELSKKLGVVCVPFDNLYDHIQYANTIIVATNATEPIINAQNLSIHSPKTFIDISIPSNVAGEVKNNEYAEVIDVDQLSRINDDTLKLRQAEVPKAKVIIAFHIRQFGQWYEMRKNAPYLKVVKEKIIHLHKEHFHNEDDNKIEVERLVKQMATKMKNDNSKPGCTYIETLHSFISSDLSVK